MTKCDTCENKKTGWCRGCEHNFPGVDQFDFYQEIRPNHASHEDEQKK